MLEIVAALHCFYSIVVVAWLLWHYYRYIVAMALPHTL